MFCEPGILRRGVNNYTHDRKYIEYYLINEKLKTVIFDSFKQNHVIINQIITNPVIIVYEHSCLNCLGLKKGDTWNYRIKDGDRSDNFF